MPSQRLWNVQLGTQIGHVTDTQLPVHLKTIEGNNNTLLRGPAQMRFNTGMGPVVGRGFAPGTAPKLYPLGQTILDASERLGRTARRVGAEYLVGHELIRETGEMLNEHGIGGQQNAPYQFKYEGHRFEDDTEHPDWGPGPRPEPLHPRPTRALPAGGNALPPGPYTPGPGPLPLGSGPLGLPAGSRPMPPAPTPIALGPVGSTDALTRKPRRRGPIPGQGALF
jgi:hypothetical protein